MNPTQVYAVLNDAVSQAVGADTYDTIDASNLVDVGTQLITNNQTDAIYSKLLDKIGKIILSDRKYKSKWSFIAKSEIEWGAIIEKIHIGLMVAQNNSSYTWESGTAPDPFEIKNPTIYNTLFKSMDTWEIPVTIPDKQMRTAFSSASEMESFISSIFTAFENSIEFYYETMARLALNTYVCEKKVVEDDVDVDGIHVINLLTDYNALLDTPKTLNEVFYDKEFLRYAVSRISDIKGLMGAMSTVFNVKGYERFTPDENLKVVVLGMFADICKAFMESDTYHNDLVALTGYAEIPYFQTIGTGFAERSKIKEKTPTSPTTAVEVTNVVAIACDDRSVGAMLRRSNTTSQRNQRGEYTNYWAKGEEGYYLDLSENGVVFTLN